MSYKLVQIGRTGSDETSPYSVVDFDAKTAYEFVFDVLENKHEWGFIEVFRHSRVEYRYGKLLNDLPVSWKSFYIKEIKASGGWSCMDYYIK